MASEYLVIGEIAKPQGVQGQVKVRPITSDPSRFEALDFVYVLENGAYAKRNVSFVRGDSEAVYLEIEGVGNRGQAEALRGALLYVHRQNAIPLGRDEAFIVDLIGCRGVDDEGSDWGELKEVLQPGGNDVYIFRGPRGELLVPALKSVMPEVDVSQKIIRMCAARLREVALLPGDADGGTGEGE